MRHSAQALGCSAPMPSSPLASVALCASCFALLLELLSLSRDDPAWPSAPLFVCFLPPTPPVLKWCLCGPTESLTLKRPYLSESVGISARTTLPLTSVDCASFANHRSEPAIVHSVVKALGFAHSRTLSGSSY